MEKMKNKNNQGNKCQKSKKLTLRSSRGTAVKFKGGRQRNNGYLRTQRALWTLQVNQSCLELELEIPHGPQEAAYQGGWILKSDTCLQSLLLVILSSVKRRKTAEKREAWKADVTEKKACGAGDVKRGGQAAHLEALGFHPTMSAHWSLPWPHTAACCARFMKAWERRLW